MAPSSRTTSSAWRSSRDRSRSSRRAADAKTRCVRWIASRPPTRAPSRARRALRRTNVRATMGDELRSLRWSARAARNPGTMPTTRPARRGRFIGPRIPRQHASTTEAAAQNGAASVGRAIGYAVRRRRRMSRRRSRELSPPQTPCFSRTAMACSRQISRTGQRKQTSRAASDARSSSSSLSGWKIPGSTPRHSACSRQGDTGTIEVIELTAIMECLSDGSVGTVRATASCRRVFRET